jgi:hypothetical protein
MFIDDEAYSIIREYDRQDPNNYKMGFCINQGDGVGEYDDELADMVFGSYREAEEYINNLLKDERGKKMEPIELHDQDMRFIPKIDFSGNATYQVADPKTAFNLANLLNKDFAKRDGRTREDLEFKNEEIFINDELFKYLVDIELNP